MLSSPEVLIPVKDLRSSKARLAGILDADERSALALAMLGDVLDAVEGAGLSASVLSPDPDVLAAAVDHGARALEEPPDAGSLSEALEAAVTCHFRHAGSLLIILGDTPLSTAAEIQALVGLGDEQNADSEPAAGSVVIASDRFEQGTNALLLHPPTAIRLHFGPHSLPAHLADAQARGARFAVLKQPGLALDLDTAEDLRLMLDQAGDSRTRRLLTGLRIGERLAH